MKNPIEFLYFHAKLQPDSIAIQAGQSSFTYAVLLAQVRAIARKLRLAGVRPGQVVVTALPNQQVDWLVTLALMHEAVVSCSKYETLPIPDEVKPDFVITEKILPEIPAGKIIMIDATWFKDLPLDNESGGAKPYGGSDSLFRLVLTSGTTGRGKAAAITVAGFMHRSSMTAPSCTFTREIGLMGLSTVSGCYVALGKLIKGLTLYFAFSFSELVTMTNAYQIECISGSPDMLSKLIEVMKHTSQRMTSLKLVWYAGGEASPRLLESMRQMLCANVGCWYGSTEIGGASLYLTHDPQYQSGMTGYVVPEADVEVVDADQRPLPFGQEGVIRTRTPGIALGYYNNPEETQRSFRDGWFYPGDRGMLLANGSLILAGRESELINRGGGKIAPRDIDQPLLDYPGILDAAAFGFDNHLGLQDVCAAIVVAEGFDMNAFQSYIQRTLISHLQPTLFLTMKQLPRNAMGKIMRAQLQEQHGESLRQKMAAKVAQA